MTAITEPATAPAALLTPAQRAGLAAVFADAVDHRTPGACNDGDCSACDPDTGVLCGDHEADLDRADAHARLRDELGIEEQ